MRSFEGKHIVIVGGGAALAQPLMKELLKQGASVTALCRKSGSKPAEWLSASDGKFQATTTLLDDYQRPDAAVIMPASTLNSKLLNMTDEEWVKVLVDTLEEPFKALRGLLPQISYDGEVVVVGSIVGSTGGYGCANYAAAKAGLVGLVRSAALEHPDLRINLLELGYIDAGMGARLPQEVRNRVAQTIPMRRFGTEEEFVRAALFLLDAPYMTGGVLTVAGGLR